MLNSIIRFTCISAFLFLSNVGFCQMYVDTIPVMYDAYIDQGNPTTNYGNDTIGKVGHYTDSSTHYQRFYVYFPLDSIPAGARVAEAEINIPYFGQVQTIDSIAVYKVDSLWYEDSITANNQPAISTYDDGSWTWHQASTKTLKLEVQGAVNAYHEDIYHDNFGFVVEMESEVDTNFALIDLYTSEHSDTTKRPFVIIKYFYPTEITNINITHESYDGADDGSISFATIKAVPPYTYQWVDATGSVISTDSIIDSLSAGWYGVYINSAVGGWVMDEFYKEFLVGVECDTVNISVTLDATYSLMAIIGNSSGWPDKNNPNGWAVLAQHINGANARTLYKAPIYIDPAFNVQSVDFTIQGSNHIGNTTQVNKAQLMMITEDWWERGVTYNNQPIYDTSNWVLVDSTNSTTQDRTVDVTDFWEYWQANDSLNYGMMFKIIDETVGYNVRQLHYPPSASASLRPTFDFVLDLTRPNTPLVCNPNLISHKNLQKKLDGSYVKTVGGKLKFAFKEEYYVDTSEYLIINIYDNQHNAIATCDRTGSTSGGMTALKYNFDDNRYELDLSSVTGITEDEYYILEVVNSKGDKKYLRLLYQA